MIAWTSSDLDELKKQLYAEWQYVILVKVNPAEADDNMTGYGS